MIFDAFKEKISRNIFLNEDISMPTSYKLGMSTTKPLASGTNISEPNSTSGYQRVALTLSYSDGVISNANEINYGYTTAAWGKLTYAVLFDQNDVPVLYTPLASTITVNSGDPVRIRTGDIRIRFAD